MDKDIHACYLNQSVSKVIKNNLNSIRLIMSVVWENLKTGSSSKTDCEFHNLGNLLK